MKKQVLLGVALLLATTACQRDITGPGSVELLLEDAANLIYDAAGVRDHGYYLAGLYRLPDDLALTEEQASQIRSAVEAFHAATQADREALVAIQAEARRAHEAGATREEVRAILAQGAPIRERIEAAEAALLDTILSILTPAQKEWLSSDRPRRCDSLTAAQRDQIAALIAAYEETNAADIQAVQQAVEAARAAKRAGASREEIRAILEEVHPAMRRLRMAREELQAAIRNVLDGQFDSRCYRRMTDRR